ncbi:MAG: YHS domain-containing protein [wastewater metagenome]|nr:YHS domain-containing protein [Candidatus Loosdrechtia aerotolerans]
MKNERSRESTGHIAQIKAEEKGKKAEVAEDPVCGMEVRTTEKALSEEYQGKTYYFCSEYCHKAFKKTPQAYTTPSKIPGYGKERDTYY